MWFYFSLSKPFVSTMNKQLELFEEEKKDQINKIDDLVQRTGRYRKSSEFKELLDFCAKFRSLSAYNSMLVQMQRPGARYVLSAAAWDKKFKVQIKINARPVIVLIPFGPVDYLFDIDDTTIVDQYSFLEDVESPFKTKGKISYEVFKTLLNNLKFIGIHFETVVFGSQQNAEIRYSQSLPIVSYKIKKKVGSTSKVINLPQYYQISVNSRNSDTDNFAAITHELGHFFCNHMRPPETNWWNVRMLDYNIEEFEAETVSWLLCERLGVDNPSEKYLSGYLNNEESIPDVSVEMILKAVNQIEMMLEPISLRTSLLAKKDKWVKEQLN